MKNLVHTMTQLSRGVLGVALGLMLAIPVSAETLTVYTAVEAEDLKRYASEFNKDHPDIKIRWVRDSTGIVTAKLLAEKNNPRADIIWGLAATSRCYSNQKECCNLTRLKVWVGLIRNSVIRLIHQAGQEWMPGLPLFV